jgi:Flp pilus assembly protein TadB
MARRAVLRASDAERDEVAERLRQAAIDGRLLAEELEDRLAAALTARTHGELDALVADLPQPRSRRRGGIPVPRTGPEIALAIVLAVLAVIVLMGLALLMAGVFFLWGFWIVFGFMFFGRGHRGAWRQRSIPGPPGPYRRGGYSYTRRSIYGPRRL